MSKNLLLGYVVQDISDYFVHHDFARTPQTWLSDEEPLPIPAPDAYRRAAQYMQEHPEAPMPLILDVERELTPLEKTASDLGQRLTSLCNMHGLDLGISQDEIDEQLARELTALRAH